MYADEERLKRKKLIREMAEEAAKEQVEEEKQESIFDGNVRIYGEEFVFERRIIEEAGISIIMPVIFEKLDEEIRKAMFPFGHAPELVYSSDRDMFNIAWKKTSHLVPEENIMEFTKISCRLLERMGPQSKILKKYLCDLGERKIGVMEFLTMAMDGRVQNINCLLPLEEGVMIVSFTFLSKTKERMYPIVSEMIHSIEFLQTAPQKS